MTTYTEIHKDYYWKNREKILEKTRVRRILNSRDYYERHKEEINAKRRKARAKRAAAKKAMGVQLSLKI